jgi:two-component SAPR family response regulator
MLSVVLFGSMSASLKEERGGTVKAVKLTPRVAELLAFLAVRRGRFFQRSELSESLWNQDERDTLSGTVNTALWRLRGAIERPPAKPGDFLVANQVGAIGLNGPCPVLVDVIEFDRLARQANPRALDRGSDADLELMRDAVEMYRDNALADFDRTWALSERERLRNVFLNLAGDLMRAFELRGECDEAIRYAHLILAVDPLREDVHRGLMRQLVSRGQRALALRQFELCRAALLRELSIPPMPETVALYRQIADAAVGLPLRGPALESAARSARPRKPSESAADLDAASPAGAAQHVERARALLAEADSHLKQSLDPVRP